MDNVSLVPDVASLFSEQHLVSMSETEDSSQSTHLPPGNDHSCVVLQVQVFHSHNVRFASLADSHPPYRAIVLGGPFGIPNSIIFVPCSLHRCQLRSLAFGDAHHTPRIRFSGSNRSCLVPESSLARVASLALPCQQSLARRHLAMHLCKLAVFNPNGLVSK